MRCSLFLRLLNSATKVIAAMHDWVTGSRNRLERLNDACVPADFRARRATMLECAAIFNTTDFFSC